MDRSLSLPFKLRTSLQDLHDDTLETMVPSAHIARQPSSQPPLQQFICSFHRHLEQYGDEPSIHAYFGWLGTALQIFAAKLNFSLVVEEVDEKLTAFWNDMVPSPYLPAPSLPSPLSTARLRLS